MIKIASLAGALAVGVGLALAAPANADADADAATDEYIQWLDHNSILYKSEQDAIDTGFALCGKIRDSQNYESLIDAVGDARVFRTFGSGIFATGDVVDSASFALCPDTSEALNDQFYATMKDQFHSNPRVSEMIEGLSGMTPDPASMYQFLEWNPEDPDRAQKTLDNECTANPGPECNPLPEQVANRLGGQDNPATRLTMSRLCFPYSDSPPCV